MPTLAYTAPEGTPEAVARIIESRLPKMTGRVAYDEPLAEAWSLAIEDVLDTFASECLVTPPCSRIGSAKMAGAHTVRHVAKDGTTVRIEHGVDGHSPQDTATATRVITRGVAVAVARAESQARATYATVERYAPTLPK